MSLENIKMMQKRWNNQLKILGEIAASKFPVKHAVQFIVRRYEGLLGATETKISMGFSKEFSKILGTATLRTSVKGWRKGTECSVSFGFKFSFF